MAAQPRSSMEKPCEDGPEAQSEMQRQMMQMLKKAQQATIQPPPNNHLPPPFTKQNGPLPFRESPMNEPSFAGIPIGRGPPQSAFPMAPGPPQKIWLLEKEIIQKAQAAKAGSPHPVERSSFPAPVFVPMATGTPNDQVILSSSPQSSSQADRVWQHLFPNVWMRAQAGPELTTSNQGESAKPADLGNMGLKQILGRVVDVTELEGVMGLNQSGPTVRPPPGFENCPTPPPVPESRNWLFQKGGGGALPPPSVAGSPQHGVSLKSRKHRIPIIDLCSGTELPAEPAAGGFGGGLAPGGGSPVVGAPLPQPSGGFSSPNQQEPPVRSRKHRIPIIDQSSATELPAGPAEGFGGGLTPGGGSPVVGAPLHQPSGGFSSPHQQEPPNGSRKWRIPIFEQLYAGTKTPPVPAEQTAGGFGGGLTPGAGSPVVGAHRPQPGGGFSSLNQQEPRNGSSAREAIHGFWDNFLDPFSRKAGKGSGSLIPESSVIEASQRLELLDLRENHRDSMAPDQGGEEKKKNKRRRRSKKRSKKTSECGETVEPPPPNPPPPQQSERSTSISENNIPSTPNGETAPERKRPRRKSRGKKSKSDPGAFEEYLDIDTVMEGLKNSTLVKGEIRINAKNYKECYINHPDDKKDILISGTLDRNRALEGDVVVVQLKDDEDATSGSQKSGKVVYILEKVHSRVCVGYLTKIGESDYATLCPRDSRIPRLLIPLTTLSVHIVQNPSAYENILFKAKIVSWESPNFAQGLIVEELGKKGNVEVETVAILKELDLDGDPVPEELSRYLPNSYSITQEEIDKRLDLRKECIFTIDPETARDLDDAVSVKKLGEDLYEVGVHISDVSQYLKLGTPLDVKVSERATTIYLVDKAIHMLPLELCLQCSLLPGQDKYAVSVIWQMDSKGNIKETKFARTVINSCTKLSYEHAQAIIEGRDPELPTLYNNVTPDMIKESVLELYEISKHMTKRRFDGGALRIDQPKVCFRVNEKAVPTGASLYELKDSNRLIEEFMLRANESVAEFIHAAHPKIALLRRHAPPKVEMMNKLQQSLSTIGIDIDISSAGEIHKCIVENSLNERARGIVLSMLCAKPMTRAEYFCNEPDSHHYALNIDMYTHFTSPIRRYCDIVVHRILCATLGYNELPKWDTFDIKQFCRTSNKKKNAAKRAGEMSSELYTALYIREQGGMQVEGIVQNVISHALDIIVVPLALSTRVYLDRLPAKLEYVENSFNSSLTITWNHVPSIPATYRLFSTVPVYLKTQETHLSIDTQLIPPVPIPEKPQPPPPSN